MYEFSYLDAKIKISQIGLSHSPFYQSIFKVKFIWAINSYSFRMY